MKDILDKTERILKLRNYSLHKRKAYLLHIKEYIKFSKNTKINFKQNEIEDFLLEKYEKKQSPQTVNLALNAIKFLYKEVLKNPEKINLKFSKRSRKLPVVLSRQEIAKIIETTVNINRFKNVKQAIAFLGLSPRNHESGTSIKGRGNITKKGNEILRCSLFQCSWYIYIQAIQQKGEKFQKNYHFNLTLV